MTKKFSESIPKKMQVTYHSIVSITDAVCREHLTDEYVDLCHKLTAKLSRKRPSPLERGRPKSWAGAILYTIARVNFLFDSSQDPHMTASELCEAVGVSQGTASAKSTQIMDMLNIVQMHPDWSLPSQLDQNPLAWLIQVNGLIVDARHMPHPVQEEAFRMGLIPYIPDDEDTQ